MPYHAPTAPLLNDMCRWRCSFHKRPELDFAHMAVAVPGCFPLAGNGTDGAHARPRHSVDYDFNDAGLVPGSSFWVTLAEQQLAVRTGDV